MRRILCTFIACMFVVSLQACKEKGSFEKAGERVDEIGDNIKDGDPPLKKKGTGEKIGESIDETLHGDKSGK